MHYIRELILFSLCIVGSFSADYKAEKCQPGITEALDNCVCDRWSIQDIVVCSLGNTAYSQLPEFGELNRTIDSIRLTGGNITRIGREGPSSTYW